MFLNPSLDPWKPTCFLALQHLSVGSAAITKWQRDICFIITFIHYLSSSPSLCEKQLTTTHTGHGNMLPLTFAFSIQPQDFPVWVAQLQHGSWRKYPAKVRALPQMLRIICFHSRGQLSSQSHGSSSRVPPPKKTAGSTLSFQRVEGDYSWRPSHFNGSQWGTCS